MFVGWNAHVEVTNPTVKSYEGKGKMHPCTGTEVLYRPYGPYRK